VEHVHPIVWVARWMEQICVTCVLNNNHQVHMELPLFWHVPFVLVIVIHVTRVVLTIVIFVYLVSVWTSKWFVYHVTQTLIILLIKLVYHVGLQGQVCVTYVIHRLDIIWSLLVRLVNNVPTTYRKMQLQEHATLVYVFQARAK